MSGTSIHPAAIHWRPARSMRSFARDSGWECELGYVFKAATGLWQATHHHGGDLGEFKRPQNARVAVEEWKP